MSETVITDQPTTVPAEGNIMLFLFYLLLGNILINIYINIIKYGDFNSVLMFAGYGPAF
jgi:hypothetical protein